MKARMMLGLVLAVLPALLLAPLGRAVQADTAPAAPVVMSLTSTLASDEAAKVSTPLKEQTQAKAAVEERLKASSQAPGARLGEAPDMNQPSVAEPVARGALSLTPETQAAYAYVQPYQEPNNSAHRNYCGPGSAVALLSHWDPDYPHAADIDQLGREMKIDPGSGVWIRDIVKPVNDRLNKYLGEDLNWYQYGKATSLEDLRWMIKVDIQENAMPFITGLYTGGLPGWGSTDVGHIVAVYGYARHPDGTEWVSYIDTAPPASGYHGQIMNTVELGQFWQAVSQNSAQVW